MLKRFLQIGRRAIKLLEYLQSEGFALNKDVGIITFYSGQFEKINQELRDAKLCDIAAQTVDGFQGEEKEIIIISFVRSNKANSVGFLNDFRRLNVAITRARRALIMIGDSATLAMDETLCSMLGHILQNKNLHKASYIEREILSKSRQSLELKSKSLSSHAFQKVDWSSFKKEPSFLPPTESQQSLRQASPSGRVV